MHHTHPIATADHHTTNSTGKTIAVADRPTSPYLRLANVTIPRGTTAMAAVRAAGADFEVRKAPVTVPNPNNPAELIHTGGWYTYRDRVNPSHRRVRSIHGRITRETPTAVTVFGRDVTDRYQIIQVPRVVALVEELVGEIGRARYDDNGNQVDGAHFTAVGTINDGAQFFGVVDLPDQVIDTHAGPDIHGAQLVVIADHTGGSAVRFVRSTFRFYCTNQLAGVAARSQVSIKHRGDVELSIGQAKRQLGLVLTSGEEYAEICERLIGEGMPGMSLVRRVADVLWPHNPRSDRSVENRRNRLLALDRLVDVEARRTGERTRYAGLQALTAYNEHIARTRLGRAERATSGAFMRRNRRIAEMLLVGEGHPALAG